MKGKSIPVWLSSAGAHRLFAEDGLVRLVFRSVVFLAVTLGWLALVAR